MPQDNCLVLPGFGENFEDGILPAGLRNSRNGGDYRHRASRIGQPQVTTERSARIEFEFAPRAEDFFPSFDFTGDSREFGSGS
jgi:hypothetical protein